MYSYTTTFPLLNMACSQGAHNESMYIKLGKMYINVGYIKLGLCTVHFWVADVTNPGGMLCCSPLL